MIEEVGYTMNTDLQCLIAAQIELGCESNRINLPQQNTSYFNYKEIDKKILYY